MLCVLPQWSGPDRQAAITAAAAALTVMSEWREIISTHPSSVLTRYKCCASTHTDGQWNPRLTSRDADQSLWLRSGPPAQPWTQRRPPDTGTREQLWFYKTKIWHWKVTEMFCWYIMDLQSLKTSPLVTASVSYVVLRSNFICYFDILQPKVVSWTEKTSLEDRNTFLINFAAMFASFPHS